MLLNIPNLLTISRILVIPVVGLLMHLAAQPSHAHQEQVLLGWAAFIFAVAATTDVVDGYLARRWKQVSLIGKFFDPMADKLIHMAALVFLIPLDRLPAWIVAALLFREIFVTGLRSVAVGEGLVIDAGRMGKWKTVWLNCGLTGLIAHYPLFAGKSYEVNTQAFGMACVTIGFVFAMLSGIEYTVLFFKTHKGKSA